MVSVFVFLLYLYGSCCQSDNLGVENVLTHDFTRKNPEKPLFIDFSSSDGTVKNSQVSDEKS